MKETFIPGNIQISRPCGDGADYIEIEVMEEQTRLRCIEIRISYAEFAQALTGLSSLPCSFILRGTKLIGATRETMDVVIPVKHYDLNRNDEIKLKELLKPYEKNGWKGRIDDLLNPHRRGPGDQRVFFQRFMKDGKPVK